MPWPFKSLLRAVLAVALALAGPLAQADETRARLVQQQRDVNTQFAQEERACAQRFAVSACIDDVRGRRRAALAPLREQELRIDDAERRQRAAARQASIEAKQRAAAERPPPTPALRTRERGPLLPQRATPAAPSAAPVPSTSPEEAAARRRAAERRRDDGQKARLRVAKRVQAGAASGAAHSEPLPPRGPAASGAR